MRLKDWILAAMLMAIMCISAYLAIPIGVVPFTMQVLVVLMTGALIGKKAGALSQVGYVLLGSIGLPVFSGGQAGIGILLGPTGGFIMGFVVAAYVIGALTERFVDSKGPIRPSIIKTGMVMFIGLLVIYFIGWLRLSGFIGYKSAFMGGVVPFIGWDLLKVVLAAYISVTVKKALVKARLLTV